LARSVRDNPAAKAFQRADRDTTRELAAMFTPAEITPAQTDETGTRTQRTLCGEQSPGVRKCMTFLESVHGQQWGAVGFYDYLAAAAHPNVLPILHTIVDRESLRQLGTGTTDGPTAIRPDQIDVPHLQTLVSNASGALLDTWFLVAQYHGIPTTELGSTRTYYPTP
jgi:hypothetical protein